MCVAGLCILALLILCHGWTQSPTINYCFDSEMVYVTDVVITNATVDKVMSVNYTVEFTQRLRDNPLLDVIMSIAGGPHIPCIDEVGSCSYNLCYARNEIEVQIASAWRSECPVPPGLFTGYLHYKLTQTAWNTLKGRAVLIRANVINGGELVGCFRLSATVRPTGH
ncbi:uncharacterized protein [Dermacentor andersoni]|uniref:uncharacterized protein n=1 Tax=Dermacentor andersoni TaxID=34620 RepID=UPI0021551F33|nr:uncharacterized protein LOC126544781 [Dermacentor andersoni]